MEEAMKFIEKLDYENAKIHLENLLKTNDSDTEILDLYSEVLINLDLVEEAKKVLNRSITLQPLKNGDKYMSLAQLSDYKLALKLYQKGIEVYQTNLNDNPNNSEIKSSISSGYAALAELYMKSELCNEPNAENLVENFLSTAVHFDNNNTDALIQYSNLRILRCRDQEALSFMDKILLKIENYQLNKLEDYPDHETLTNLAKNYVELEIYDKAIKTLDILVKMDDENVEDWYLLAFSHFKIQNYKFSLKCLKNLKKIAEKIKSNDKDILEASEELFHELEKLKDKNGELYNNKDFVDDNDYVEEDKDMNFD